MLEHRRLKVKSLPEVLEVLGHRRLKVKSMLEDPSSKKLTLRRRRFWLDLKVKFLFEGSSSIDLTLRRRCARTPYTYPEAYTLPRRPHTSRTPHLEDTSR